jgi:hypothetical protein
MFKAYKIVHLLNEIESQIYILFIWCSWLRRYATSRKVAGSSLEEVIYFVT